MFPEQRELDEIHKQLGNKAFNAFLFERAAAALIKHDISEALFLAATARRGLINYTDKASSSNDIGVVNRDDTIYWQSLFDSYQQYLRMPPCIPNHT